MPSAGKKHFTKGTNYNVFIVLRMEKKKKKDYIKEISRLKGEIYH
jgi:hypothetical protein